MYFSEQGDADDDATLITIFLVSFNLQSCCLVQSAVCSLQSAVCSLQSAVCSLQSAVCSLQSANVIHRRFRLVSKQRKTEERDFWSFLVLCSETARKRLQGVPNGLNFGKFSARKKGRLEFLH